MNVSQKVSVEVPADVPGPQAPTVRDARINFVSSQLDVKDLNVMKIHLRAEIAAPADATWEVVGRRFAEIAEWSSAVETSRTIAVSEVPASFAVAPDAPVPGRGIPNPLGEVVEVLTQYSDDERTFTFEANGPAPIFSHTQNTTKVTSQGANSCLVTTDLVLSPRGVFKLIQPLLAKRFQTSGRGPAGVIKDLKQHMEAA